jgi:CRP-like cAMP-binding protein
MFYCTVKKGETLFAENDPGYCLFVLERGELEVFIKGESKCKLQRGKAIGEIALLFTCPRSATVKAHEDCYCWAIHRFTFRKVPQI